MFRPLTISSNYARPWSSEMRNGVRESPIVRLDGESHTLYRGWRRLDTIINASLAQVADVNPVPSDSRRGIGLDTVALPADGSLPAAPFAKIEPRCRKAP